ncbi:uncharacterized protein LOC135118904 [Helicoverpa armigera]|uniref:uncharacterized protein LOC135118904 n=1 Tax=Helicoverpa armigera TaxID=29058 RepID=UPI003082B572
MSKLSFRARALDASKPMPIYLAEELPDLPDYSAINRAVPQMPSGMEKEEESEHHLQKAISGTGLIIPTPEVCQVSDLEFYERCYPPDYKMPKQHIHMQPLWEEQEAPEYDIDTDDERWLKQQRHPELTELKFEQMMDKLEKSSGQTVVTLNEAKLLLERNDDLVIAVYDYWLNKRLNTQHPLVLSVKTENRPGQSSNNPYLAFRRRTEKMQTRKNRKNDESSYEKMLKLRRDLARALNLLELVARRESAKRELVRLTALIAERRYAAGDFANQLLPDPPPRPAYTPVPLTSSSFRREAYPLPHYTPRPPPAPVDQPRQREKRPYKRRKHRHPVVGSVQGLRDSGVYTSSEEEGSGRADAATPPDDGPFAFRRKPGCYYEMPTSTLYGDPVDPDDPSKDGMFEHEMDERHRYTLTSLRSGCIGFARRRLCRGGRVALDRTRTPLHDLFTRLPFPPQPHQPHEDIETKAQRTPKELSMDYHSSGKYPWRHAFRRHLARNPDLWTADTDIKQEPTKSDLPDVRSDLPDIRSDLPDVIQDSVNSVKSDIRFSARTLDGVVRDNLQRVMRKRAWSGCSDSSYDSDESLQPVEKEFEQFINEVNKKWLHFRPKTPPPSPPRPESHDTEFPVSLHTPIAVEIRSDTVSDTHDTFTTSEFTLADLYPDINPVLDNSVAGLDVSSDDLLSENFTGLSEMKVDSLAPAPAPGGQFLSAPAAAGGPVVAAAAEASFLSHGQSTGGRAHSGPDYRKADSFGSTVVNVTNADKEPIYIDMVKPEPPPIKIETPKPTVKEEKIIDVPAPVPTSNIIIEEVNEVPHIKIEKKRKEDTIEEVQLPHGVQLKTVQTKHSPLKKHIISSAGHRRASDVTIVTSVPDGQAQPHTSQPQIVTVAVSDSLKVRLQNHLVSGQAGVVVGNGPFPGVVGARAGGLRLPVHKHVPLVVPHAPHSKLKVLHAHPLSHSQRAALLAQNRALHLPAVVSLAALDKAAGGSVAQLFEIKAGQLGKGPHLVNVVRQAAPRPALQLARRPPAVTVAPRALVANLLHKAVPLPHKLLPPANVSAIAFAAPQLKRRPPRPDAPPDADAPPKPDLSPEVT